MIEKFVNQNYPNRTMIQFKLYGIVIHTENYPRYVEGSESLKAALRDAEKRFAAHLAKVLSRPDPMAVY